MTSHIYLSCVAVFWPCVRTSSTVKYQTWKERESLCPAVVHCMSLACSTRPGETNITYKIYMASVTQKVGDAAVGLGLHFLHMPEGPFSHDAGHINKRPRWPQIAHLVSEAPS